MTYSSPSGLQIFYDDSGGTPVDISAFVLDINEFVVENILENSRTYGKAWEEFLSVGIGKCGVVEIKGNYDNAAAAPNALFGGQIPVSPATASRTLKIFWVPAAQNTLVETRIISFTRQVMREGLTKYIAKLQPTGTVTEAAS